MSAQLFLSKSIWLSIKLYVIDMDRKKLILGGNATGATSAKAATSAASATSAAQYKVTFHNLLYLEELQLESDISSYNETKAKLLQDNLRSTDDEPRFILKVMYMPALLDNGLYENEMSEAFKLNFLSLLKK